MEYKLKQNVEYCPFCGLPVIFTRYSDFLKHLEPCSGRDAREKLLSQKKLAGSLKNLREIEKIVRVVKEFEDTDEAFKEFMIMCPVCLTHRNSIHSASFLCHVCDTCCGRMIPVREFVAEYTLDAASVPKF